MWPKHQIRASSLSQNKNARKRRDRTALRYENMSSFTHIADNIYHGTFKVDGKEVIFLLDIDHPKWVVSECDEYIIGSGVIKKMFEIEP